jgi:hypothetical protein
MRHRIIAAFVAFALVLSLPAVAGAGKSRAPGRSASPKSASTEPAPETPPAEEQPGDPAGEGEPPPVPEDEAPPAEPETTPWPPCTDDVDGAVEFTIPIDGDDRDAHGFYAVPATDPVGMVVFSHGYGHSSYSWQDHAARVAEELNVVTVAVDGRDLTILDTFKRPGIPNTAGWPVKSAAEDGLAAAAMFESACSTIETIVNYGVSLGGNTSGIMAAAGAKRADGTTPMFDWWVDVEGVNNLIETYMEARAADPGAAGAIQIEAGGPIELTGPEPYLERTNVALVDKMKAAGLKGVVLVHGVDDGLVPHNQSDEMFAALTAVGIPAQFFVVTLKSDESERETTGTGHVLGRLDPEYRSPLSGHASELSETHIVGLTGFERLTAIFNGQPPACTRVAVVDGQVGSTPLVDC